MSQFVPRNCPVCGRDAGREVLQKEDLRLVECGRCSMVYANPVGETLASGEFYDQLAAPFYLSPDKLESDYSPVRFEREIRLFRQFCPKEKVLDVGCSTGAFLFELCRRFGSDYDVLGMDVAGPALDYAQSRGIPTRKEPYLTAEFAGATYAAVTFWAVLEHLANPRDFLAKTASLLAPGGHCFILVPNYRSMAMRLLGAKYRYILPQHVNYFSAATLAGLAAAEPGLQVVHLRSTHFNPLVIYQDWKGSGKNVPDAERARLLRKTTAYKRNPLLKPVKAALGMGEAVLGRFGLADNLAMVLRRKT